MIKGKNLIIYEGSPAVAVAACKSFSIVTKAELLEDSSPASGQARTYSVGRMSFEVSVSTLVLAMKGYMLRKGQTYFLTWKDSDNPSDVMSGSAICTSAQIVATRGNIAQGSLQFMGLDDMTPAFPEPVPTAPDFNNDFNGDFNNN